MLTAIVISFGVTALLLALAYRSWLLTDDDEVDDDVDDRNVGRDSTDDTEVADAGRADADVDGRGRPVSVLLPLPIVLPLLAAALCILAGGSRTAQRIIGLTTLSALVPIAVAILVRVDADGIVVVQAGDWPAPIGITLVADRLSAIMLVTASVVLLAVLVYAIGQPGAERNHVGFQSVYMILAAGVAAAFLTGDLFNLFVAIEMMLTASYVLITLGGRLEQVRSGMTYVVISLVASVLFLRRPGVHVRRDRAPSTWPTSPGASPTLPSGVQAALAGLLLVVFGIKAALFPLYFWLPDSYPTAPSAVTAIFAGLLTKVGVYAIIRTQTAAVPARQPAGDADPRRRRRDDGRRRPRRHRPGGRQADLLVLHRQPDRLHHHGPRAVHRRRAGRRGLRHRPPHRRQDDAVPRRRADRARRRHRAGSTASAAWSRTAPVIAVLFLLPALSLAGIPPFSGFVAKFGLFDATARSREWTILAVAVVVSLLTLFSIFKIWIAVFWSPPGRTATVGSLDRPGARVVRRRRPAPLLMLVPTAVLAVLTLAIGVGAGPLYDLSDRAAVDLVDPTPLPRGGAAAVRAVAIAAGWP